MKQVGRNWNETLNEFLERQLFAVNFAKRFKIVDIGEAKWILATKLTRTIFGLTMDQKKYVNDVLHRFGMTDCKEIGTPAAVETSSDDTPFEDKLLFMSLVGCLIYLSIVSRPDISFAVGKVS